MHLSGQVDLDHPEFRVIFPVEPTMGDTVSIPLFGSGVVAGLNDNYMGREETWVMVQWADGRTTQFEYRVTNGDCKVREGTT